MKIAYFSPFPPKQTGIATYSSHLVPELRKQLDVDGYDFDNEAAGDPGVTFGDFSIDGRTSLSSYASVIYHLGNNPHYHLTLYRMLREFPGVVVLHDVVLYYLFAGTGREGLIKHFLLNYGIDRLPEIGTLFANCAGGDLFRYPTPEKYPLVASIFPFARRIIVHNHFAEQLLKAAGYLGPIHVIPMLSYQLGETKPHNEMVTQLRRRLGIDAEEIVIGCFGFIGRTKRMEQVCQALSLLGRNLSFKLLIVGEGDDVTDLLTGANLVSRTIRTRFVGDDEFTDYLACTDIVVNLRYPSMGESSITLTQAMRMGKACIVTNDASFRELPDTVVWKINLGDTEVAHLAEAISSLSENATRRAEMGRAAETFTRRMLEPGAIAAQFYAVFEADSRQRATETLLADARDPGSVQQARRLLEASLEAQLPEHLRLGKGGFRA